MGTVYAAVDTALERRVPPRYCARISLKDGLRLSGFIRSAACGGICTHPNVVTVHDIGMAGGRAFFIMELLEGETLRAELLRAGRSIPRAPLQ